LDCSISDAKGLSELKPSVFSALTIYLLLSLRSWAMNLEATFGEKQHLEGRGRDNLHGKVLSLHSIIDTGTFPGTPASTLFATCSTLAAYATWEKQGTKLISLPISRVATHHECSYS
jgi:hypothetical protein